MEGPGSLVGRDAEIARISSFLDHASERPAALHIAGEPGIGKTSIWLEGLRHAEERGFRILIARPAESDVHLSFGGLDDLLRKALPDVLDTLPAPQRRALRVALLLDEPEGAPPDVRTVAVATREVLRALARRAPVLVAVDDLQWLDAPTVTVLAHAFRRVEQDCVSVLMTGRAAHPMPSDLAAALEREGLERLSLGQLSLGATHRLIVDRLGRSLSRPAVTRVHETSGGNPFFALEIARALLKVGGRVRPGEPLSVPDDLRALLRMRLEGLPRVKHDVLAVVALLSDRSEATIERIAGDDAAGALQSAIDAGLLEVDGDRVRFTHPLLAAAVASNLLPETARSIHARIAETVADPEERARHLALAANGPDGSVAEALDLAARHAAGRGATSVAGDLGELAARLTPHDDAHGERRRRLDAGRQLMLSGEMERAAAIAHGLLDEPLSRAERADTLLLVSEIQENFDGSKEMAAQALVEAEGDPERSIRALSALAGFKLNLGDIRAALDDARNALEMAERLGDLAHLVPALGFVAMIELWANSITPGLLDRGVELEEASSHVEAEVSGLIIYSSPSFIVAWTSMLQDRLDDARRGFEEVHARAVATGDEVSRVAVLLHLTELECRAGGWAVAAQLAAEAFEAEQQLGIEYQPASALYPRALVDAHLGEVSEARAMATQGVATAASQGDEIFRMQNASVLGFLELSLGDAKAADGILRPLADHLEELGWMEPSGYRVLPNAIEALVAVGELDEARRLLTRLEVNGAAANSVWAEACAGRCRGMLRAAEGDVTGAIEALKKAVELHATFPGPFEEARTRLALGVVQRRAKQKAAARASISAALERFRELGARLWAERAADELGRIGGRAPSPLELTPTERRVAALVSEGLSNREVADRLFVSTRTVEGHLSSAFRKLGVRSRTALASRLASSDVPGAEQPAPDEGS